MTKTENADSANAKLENLAIENVTLDPEFDADILSYYAIVGSDVESIHLLAFPQIEGANVTVTGTENLQFRGKYCNHYCNCTRWSDEQRVHHNSL